ncbi:MAG: D-alanyl-D-alanine carboxypeptidase/D-alanyl-D-alanine-endopeptidase [bacterium]|nr:D-alanyl-D-alanine carboxypeptidase/D-alanyl-D-alanine-endopeptidase [bacterium]
MYSYIKLVLILLCFSKPHAETPDRIIQQLNDMIQEVPASTKMAIMIYDPLTQDTLVSINHTSSMIPASNTKLFTTATALELMGGDYLISTKIFADDEDFSDGVLDGNIYIKGFGNPTFTTENLEDLVNKLYQAGLRKITGNIFGDDTYFDNIYSRDDWISEERANVKLPPISALVIDRNRTVVTKKRKGRYRNYFVNVKDPPSYAAKMLKEKLKVYGVEAEGKSLSGKTPDNSILLLESSIELRELIKEINKSSDNFYAECLFKTLGSYYSGQQGNSFYSTQAVLNFIEDNSIYSTGTKIVDGSGISRFDQVTAGAIVGLLEKVYFNIEQFDDFYNSLSIAGIDGTLHRRMIGTTAENNFRGKTGTLNGVSSLAGYVTTADEDDLIVCIIFEFVEGGASKHKKIQDRIVEALADWKK